MRHQGNPEIFGNTRSKYLLANKKKPDFPGLTINDTLENMKILDNWLN